MPFITLGVFSKQELGLLVLKVLGLLTNFVFLGPASRIFPAVLILNKEALSQGAGVSLCSGPSLWLSSLQELALTSGSCPRRVAVVGNVDAGKSTLLGVLTHGELDNGRGFARQKLFRHKHEIESGRTSSVGNDILGFDSEGNVVNKPDSHGGSLEWTKICEKSSKVITFIDLAGHEKYLKTTVFGMTGHLPDFCMLMVSVSFPSRGPGMLCKCLGSV